MQVPSHDISPAQSTSAPFAEVMQSNLNHFIAQSWQWDHFPDFGSLVQVQSGEITIFGCVTQINTGSMDPMRYPFAYQKTEQELRAEQPQIFEFLKTTFDCLILGYQAASRDRFEYLLPSKPCKMHAFVQEVKMSVAGQFFASPLFLPLLFASQTSISNLDELLLSILRLLKKEKILNKTVFGQFYESMSLLSGNDYRRMKLFLQRAEHVLKND
jgi:hypothetical protein